MSFMRSCKKIL